jgi:RNA polymerase sigma-70 factor (ECF subfamily)
VLGNREDAEDAAQEALVRAIERIDTLREPAAFGGWVLQIAATVALNARARRKLRTHEEFADDAGNGTAVPFAERPEDEAERSDLRARFASALAELPEAARASVLLCFVEGWNAREAAEVLGVAHGTVRSHLHRARRHLRRRLGG